MHPTMYFCAGFGVCFGATVLAAVVVDTIWIRSKTPSISRRTLVAGWRHPIVAAGIAAVLSLITGILIGHLWFPQFVYPALGG